MPQPIRDKLTTLRFERDAVVQSEKLAAHFLCAVNEWSRTEGTLGVLLGQILNVRYAVATEILGAVVNFTARLDVVRAAAKARLEQVRSEETCALMDQARRRAGERNDLAHGIWGVSSDYPARLLRCPPDKAFSIVNRHYEVGMTPREVLDELKPHLELWDDKSFDEVQRRFRTLQEAIITLSNRIGTERGA